MYVGIEVVQVSMTVQSLKAYSQRQWKDVTRISPSHC